MMMHFTMKCKAGKSLRDALTDVAREGALPDGLRSCAAGAAQILTI